MNKKTFIVGPPDISVKFDGNGDLVLFLHGIGGNKNNWDKNLSYISKSFLCVACDIRGYGESDDYIGPLNFLDVVEDLKKIIFYFKKHDAHIIGLSMGGQIACFFYEKYPKRVKSLILCDTHFGLGKLDKKQKEKFIDSRKKPLINGLKPKDIAHGVAKTLIGDESNLRAFNQLVDSISLLHKESYLKTIETSLNVSHEHIFKTIKIPTLVIVGELDTLTPPVMAKKIHNQIKNSDFFIINGAGHLTNIEKPDEFNRIVFNFLENLS